MISPATICFCIITLFISLILPPLFAVAYGLRHRGQGIGWAWLLGAVGFAVPQMLIRLPILNLLGTNPGFVAFAQSHPLVHAFGLAFTAGLFELAGRYAVALVLRKQLTYQRCIAAGLGHGGIEAMMLVGMTYVNNLIYIFQIQSGGFDALLAQATAMGADPAALESIRQTFLTANSSIFLLAGIERLLTMVFHTAMSLLVCYSVARHRLLPGLLVCLGLHTLVDCTAGLSLVLPQTTAMIIIYTLLTIMALLSLWIIRTIHRRWASEGERLC